MGMHMAKWKKPVKKGNILYESISQDMLEKARTQKQERDPWSPGLWGGQRLKEVKHRWFCLRKWNSSVCCGGGQRTRCTNQIHRTSWQAECTLICLHCFKNPLGVQRISGWNANDAKSQKNFTALQIYEITQEGTDLQNSGNERSLKTEGKRNRV